VAQGREGNVRLGNSKVPALPVPEDLFTVYQPLIGYRATIVWLNLRLQATQEGPFSPATLLASGLSEKEIDEAFDTLWTYRLISRSEEGEWIVHDPLPAEVLHELLALRAQRGESIEKAAAAQSSALPSPAAPRSPGPSAPPAKKEGAEAEERTALRVVSDAGAAERPVQRSPLSKKRKNHSMLKLVDTADGAWGSENPDMRAVVQIYHKRIGMIGPTQYEKLRFWIEEQGLEGAVVALAIEETVRSADVPRISYLEGILRNWYNDGIRTFAQLQERKMASKVLSAEGGLAGGDSREGVANAAAYQSVSPEMVAKWKELYPDEYDA